MPNTCNLLGTTMMYPENWNLSGPVEDADGSSFLLESPTGMFFSVNRFTGRSDYRIVLEQAAIAMTKEYRDSEIEDETYESIDAMPMEEGVELQFYCQRYIVTSRLVVIQHEADTLLIQVQAETRDFDENALVFEAMLKSLRDSLRAHATE